MKRKVIRTFLALIVVALLSSALSAQMADQVERVFEVAPGGLFTLEADRGSVEVETGGANQVEVIWEREAKRANAAEFQQMMRQWRADFQESGGNVFVRVELPDREHDRRNENRVQFRFRVRVPYQFDLDIRTSGGSISVSDLDGEVQVRTAGGSLKLGNISGQVTGRTAGGSIQLESSAVSADLKTAGGSISIGRVEGDVVASTAGGSINVEEVFGSIDASTSGGSVSARISSQPGADCKLSTSGGSVEVALARGIGVDVDARTSHGRVVTDLEIDQESDPKRKDVLQGRVSGGGPRLVLRTSGGNIRLKELN